MPISIENAGRDDRVTCRSCRNLIPWAKQCRAEPHKRYGPVMVDLPRRCTEYEPVDTEPDPRTGLERWPRLAAEIEELRALEAATQARRRA